jgi:hypothetical protein
MSRSSSRKRVTATSSCPAVSADEVRASLEQEIDQKVCGFLLQVVANLCIPEGTTGRIHQAFGINRRLIIARTMRKLGQDIEEEETNGRQTTRREKCQKKKTR